jgi:HEPN domain-containing protein
MRSPEDVRRGLVDQWIAKAAEDIGLARHIVGTNLPFVAAAGFHCQQAVEKYLKALLVDRQVEFPKTHDLGDLLDLIEPFDADLAAEMKGITWLTPYGVDFRYPSDLPAMSGEKAKQALELAVKVEAAVLKRLGRQ